MNWIELNEKSQLDEIDQLSISESVVIFKHSSRCSISSTALGRLDRKGLESAKGEVRAYFLDLLKYRELSNEIAHRYGIEHESPQVLIIKYGKCIFSSTHLSIDPLEIVDVASNAA